MARVVRSEKDPVRGERFRAICRKLFPGRSRADVGGALGGVSVSTIRNWENGFPISLDVISRLEQLGVSLPYLLRGEGPMAAAAAGGEAPLRQAVVPAAAVDAADPKREARVIGSNLRHLRKRMFPGWGGQKRFAEFLGIAPNDLCVYEYGRIVPNEFRLEEIAKRLDMPPEQLREPLPGVTVQPPAAAVSAPLGVDEQTFRERENDLRQMIARLEGRLDALQDQLRVQDERILQLQEANYAFRALIYEEASPELKERREKIIERLAQSISEVSQRSEAF